MLSDKLLCAKIMVVEDNPICLSMIGEVVKLQGYQSVELFSNPVKALDYFTNNDVDLVILDINMPQMNGIEWMQSVLTLQRDFFPPIVVLTAESEDEFAEAALELGAKDFVNKPFKSAILAGRIKTHLSTHLKMKEAIVRTKDLEQEVVLNTEQLEKVRTEVLERLGKASSFREQQTSNYLLRMGNTCALIAKQMGFDDNFVDMILASSPMHDIGKIGIPDSILKKPGALTDQEWAVMKTHVHIGAELLGDDDTGLMKMAREIALYHHERWDGSGYLNLREDVIPMSARIAAVADVYCALIAKRAHRQAWSTEMAYEYIVDQADTLFDPEVVEAFQDGYEDILELQLFYADEIRTS
ncbi:MAG: response regulator [Alteromonadaceae bacterium]|nr:response regulator [Alteromonadaceae bacterium]